MKTSRENSSAGFTLIELLVVIAILAVLAVVVVLTLNPAGLLQEARDSQRMSDMASLNSALGYSLADNAAESLGSANTVYVSIPDPSATSTSGDQCQGLSLIALPSGYSYQCAASSTYRLTNGTGWIPVSLSSSSFGSSLAQLPIDPVNTSSSRHYYTYETDGSGHFEVTATMESVKYQLGGAGDVISGDGGTLASVYEKGSKLGLEPLDYGDPTLVGLWTFQEGSGSVAYDYSGTNATGSWQGTLGNQYAAGKIGPYAGNFDGSTNWLKITSSPATFSSVVSGPNNFTITAWVNPTNCNAVNPGSIFDKFGSDGVRLLLSSGSCVLTTQTRTPGPLTGNSGPTVSTSTWSFVGVAFTSGGSVTFYLNGIGSSGGTNATTWTANNAVPDIGYAPNNASYFTGLVDDVRVYNRALSAAQIAAMYNGGK